MYNKNVKKTFDALQASIAFCFSDNVPDKVDQRNTNFASVTKLNTMGLARHFYLKW